MSLSPDEIVVLFTRADGRYAFARWGRPICPVVFGVTDETLSVLKGAIEAVVTLAGHKMSGTDPELGANLMFFFVSDWEELTDAPNIDALIPDLPTRVERLKNAQATQYRLFRFDPDGAIRACFTFIRPDLSEPAETLALTQAVKSIILWSDTAFRDTPPLLGAPGAEVLRPDIAHLIRAAYDPVLPAAAADPSHALRLFARLPVTK